MQKFLIIRTGGTFTEYAQQHQDFEHWTASRMGLAEDEWQCVNVQAGEKLPSPDNFIGCAITGSHDMVTDASLGYVESTSQWLREARKAGLPMFGICFGHQLLAHALGGEAGPHPNGPEIGTMDISLNGNATADPLFSALPNAFRGHTTHYQSALKLPTNAKVLASSTHEPNQAFCINDHIWGVQFHPEFDAAGMKMYVEEQRDAIQDNGGDADAILNHVSETPESTSLLVKFVAFCRQRANNNA